MKNFTLTSKIKLPIELPFWVILWTLSLTLRWLFA